MNIKILVILLVMGLVLGTYSISNSALAVSQPTGKLVPSDKISPPTSPPGFEKSGMTRVISSTTSEQEISNIQQKGCSVIHRLNHATSFFCPSGVVQTLDNVRPVRIYQPHDLDADIQIQADRVWNDLGFNGSGVKVAILDTGVQKDDPLHAELINSILLTADFTGEGGDNKDYNGHGTHVSGIVTADGVYSITGTSNLATGVAPGAEIIVGKVCGSSGCPEDAIIAGIEWAQVQGAHVMNLSLGGGLSYTENCDNVGDLTVAAVNNAVTSGIVTTISSGNNYSKSGVSYPGCASGAIAVGAVNHSDKVASFSNSGPALDIVAPGVDILSSYSCNDSSLNLDCNSTWYAYLSGTSMSSPHVAGVVALMLEKNPNLTVAEIKDALYSTAIKIQSGKFDGNGRVDALGAVNYEPTTLDTNPPETSIDSAVDGSGTAVSNDGTTSSNSITFTFSGTDDVEVASFECSLDTATFSVCTNPQSFGSLSDGSHAFEVRAKDAAGNTDLSPASWSWTVTITPQDPTISIGDVTLDEGNSGTTNFVFTVTRSGDTAGTSSVSFVTADDTATADGDYISLSGIVSFGNGVTQQTVTVTVNGDTIVEPDETFTVNLSNPFDATISDGQGLGTITNDDTSVGFSVDRIDPNSVAVGQSTNVIIYGIGFESGVSVTLSNGSGPTPTVSNVIVSFDGLTIDATITTKDGGPPRDRDWDVTVTNPDGSSGTLVLTVTASSNNNGNSNAK